MHVVGLVFRCAANQPQMQTLSIGLKYMFRDKNIYFALALLAICILIFRIAPEGYKLNSYDLLITFLCCFVVFLNMLFLRFLKIDSNSTDSTHPHPLGSWGYVWRITMVCFFDLWFTPIWVVPFLFEGTGAFQLLIAVVWFLLINNLVMLGLFCNTRKLKVKEITSRLRGLAT